MPLKHSLSWISRFTPSCHPVPGCSATHSYLKPTRSELVGSPHVLSQGLPNPPVPSPWVGFRLV
uniref:Uncharacterized protein n=1 Tax=Arundo donax TaxID=35708 RepID=A0A0A9EIQ4_ARUDO